MMNAEAQKLPEGELPQVLEAVAKGEHISGAVGPMYEYGLVKLIGTAWMRQLALDHGEELRAYTISPGMTRGTSGADNMPWGMRVMMKYVAMPLLGLFGKAHHVSAGASRYLQGLDDEELLNGGFYASPGTGLTGPLTLQSPDAQPLLVDDAFASHTEAFLRRLAA